MPNLPFPILHGLITHVSFVVHLSTYSIKAVAELTPAMDFLLSHPACRLGFLFRLSLLEKPKAVEGKMPQEMLVVQHDEMMTYYP